MPPRELRLIDALWALNARDDQLPPDFHHPDADWRIWLVMAGRGAGKTRAGAEWVRALANAARIKGRPLRIALLAPTLHDARSVMVEGESGLMHVCRHDGHPPRYEPALRRLIWPDGTIAQIFSAEEPDSLRGPQFHHAWCDEICRWREGGQTMWDMLMFALRLGEAPRVTVTTTPAPTPLIRRLLADPETWISHAATAHNRANLAPGFVERLHARYAGTRLARQELMGELIEDDPDALFTRQNVEKGRCTAAPPLKRIVVAVDPPAGRGPAACCGIIVAGRDRRGDIYVLEDASLERAGPFRWARAAVSAYYRHAADRIVAEINQGGEMVEALIRQVDPAAPFRAVRASRGKIVRAEPVAALYEQGRVHHLGVFTALEEELFAFEALIEAGKSPDRADALIWAVTELTRPHFPPPRIHVL
nr:terminase family protein [Thermopetrobacter sp. TC1]